MCDSEWSVGLEENIGEYCSCVQLSNVIPKSLGGNVVKVPLQISSRRISLSEAAQETIRRKAVKLENFNKGIIACRVMVEAPHKRRHHGLAYNVRLDLILPGGELVVTHEPAEDIYVAIRDTFDAARRQLQAFSRRRRGDVKSHDLHEKTPGNLPIDDFDAELAA